MAQQEEYFTNKSTVHVVILQNAEWVITYCAALIKINYSYYCIYAYEK